MAAALEPFDILVIMRERTPFPASLIGRLPNLKLLVTTGARMIGARAAALTWGLSWRWPSAFPRKNAPYAKAAG
ncbi:hypothetical protein [Azospirillum largimobile]